MKPLKECYHRALGWKKAKNMASTGFTSSYMTFCENIFKNNPTCGAILPNNLLKQL